MGIDVTEFQNRYGRAPSMPTTTGRNFDMTFDLSKFAAKLDDIRTAASKATRPAAQAGAEVLYNQVLSNVDSMLGRTYPMRMVLRGAIYQAYMDQVSGDLNARYRIGWNHVKAPHGHLVEYGHLLTYQVYWGRDGKFHTRVRPSMLKEWLQMKASGVKSVPKARRDEFYIRNPSPRFIAPRPFLRNAASRYDAAFVQMKDRFFAELNAARSLT